MDTIEDESLGPDTSSNSDYGCVATNDNYLIIYPTLDGGCVKKLYNLLNNLFLF
jgi:hypothetical protein